MWAASGRGLVIVAGRSTESLAVMQIPRSLLRRRAMQALVVLVAVWATTQALIHGIPAASKYVPPLLLVLLAIASVISVLAVWRRERLLRALFPDVELSAQDLQAPSQLNNLCVIAEVAITVFLFGHWARSLA